MENIPKEPMPLAPIQNTPSQNGWKKFHNKFTNSPSPKKGYADL